MIDSKNLGKIALGLTSILLINCFMIVYMANASSAVRTYEYEEKIFGDDVISIDIEVDEEDWQNLLDNAMSKEYISGDLIINGDRFSTVGIRTKGNSSLSQVVNMTDSDRYSLQFKANKYIKGQTFYGLDAFCINNIIGDTTYMKDYLSYDLMSYIGVDTPLTNYANVTVNGEDFGFYIALERYNKSFLDRVYSTSAGELYNVKTSMGDMDEAPFSENMGEFPADNSENVDFPFMNGEEKFDGFDGFGGDRDKDMGNMNGMEDRGQGMEDGNQGIGDNRGQGMGGMGGINGTDNKGGGSLIYTDDDISSYSSIFENAVFNKNSDKDKERVITAIKNLNEGNDLEKYIDVDKTLRYLAAHTVLVNLDSYSSSMAQNYYIYERDGKLTILPWDYNYAFGGFQSKNATDVINFPIDTPVSDVNMEDRPLINKLLEVEEYKDKYHEYLQEIVDGYFLSGLFEEKVNSLDEKINEYVKNDPSSFTGYGKYEASLPVLIELGNLRAESINGQLNGAIPSSNKEQEANESLLIDGSNIDMSSLGDMGGGNPDRKNNESHEGFNGENIKQNEDTRPDMKEGFEEKFGERKEPLSNKGELSPSTSSNKWAMVIIIFSILLFILAFGYIIRAKKNY